MLHHITVFTVIPVAVAVGLSCATEINNRHKNITDFICIIISIILQFLRLLLLQWLCVCPVFQEINKKPRNIAALICDSIPIILQLQSCSCCSNCPSILLSKHLLISVVYNRPILQYCLSLYSSCLAAVWAFLYPFETENWQDQKIRRLATLSSSICITSNYFGAAVCSETCIPQKDIFKQG